MSALGNALLTPGMCFGCTCTDLSPCADPQTGEPCDWANEAHTYCTVCALFSAAAAGLVIEEVIYQ